MRQLNIFETVKQHVTTRQAASFYGLKVNQSGMCCCPFHLDHTPSMKVDTRYHCFGCGADGDVISFVQRLFCMKPKEAAVKLINDFGISFQEGRSWRRRGTGLAVNKKKVMAPGGRIRSPDVGFRQWLKQAVRVLIDYYWLLQEWKNEYAPKNQEEEWHLLFCESLQNKSKVEYFLDILLFGSMEEQMDFYSNDKKVVDTIERRLYEYRQQKEPGRSPGSEWRETSLRGSQYECSNDGI